MEQCVFFATSVFHRRSSCWGDRRGHLPHITTFAGNYLTECRFGCNRELLAVDLESPLHSRQPSAAQLCSRQPTGLGTKEGKVYECLRVKLFPGCCERPSVSGLQHSRSSVATIARGGVLPDCDPLLRLATDTTVATDPLERRFCYDQLVPVVASLPRAPSHSTDS